jgi:hypothetical protein
MEAKSVAGGGQYAKKGEWLMSVTNDGIDIARRDPEKGWVDATADEVPPAVLIELVNALTVEPTT